MARPPSNEGKKRSFAGLAGARPSGEVDSLKTELADARARMTELEHALDESSSRGILRLDPARVRRSRLANRNPLSFSSGAFDELVHSLRSTGGNEIPVKVRPIDDEHYDYEIVYGHRRHQASIIAGTPLNATVHDVTDAQMVELMHIENEREDLSVYEQAFAFRLWLDEGVYHNAAGLAAAVNMTRSAVSERLAITELPDVVFLALRDPRRVSVTQWRDLRSAYTGDRCGVLLERAEALAVDSEELQSATESEVRQIVAKLLAQKPEGTDNKPELRKVKLPSGTPLFEARKTKKGYQIRFDNTGVPDDIQEAALKELEHFLDKHLSS